MRLTELLDEYSSVGTATVLFAWAHVSSLTSAAFLVSSGLNTLVQFLGKTLFGGSCQGAILLGRFDLRCVVLHSSLSSCVQHPVYQQGRCHFQTTRAWAQSRMGVVVAKETKVVLPDGQRVHQVLRGHSNGDRPTGHPHRQHVHRNGALASRLDSFQ